MHKAYLAWKQAVDKLNEAEAAADVAASAVRDAKIAERDAYWAYRKATRKGLPLLPLVGSE